MRARQVKLTLTGTQADALWDAAMYATGSNWLAYDQALRAAITRLEDAIAASHRRMVTVTADKRYL